MNQYNHPANSNPYAPPAATVRDVDAPVGVGALVPGGRARPAGNGVTWLGTGWSMVKQQLLPWIGLFVVFTVVYFGVSMIPFLNLLNVLLLPLLMGGTMLACEHQRASGELRVGDLFAGFQSKLGPLCLLGLFTFALSMLLMVVIFLVAGVSVLSSVLAGNSLMGALAGIGMATIVVMVVIGMLAAMFVYIAIWYAPALIVLHDLTPFDAIKMSLSGGVRNLLPGLVYGLVFTVLAIVASLPLMLGWLLLGPLLWTSTYAAYRDIFIED